MEQTVILNPLSPLVLLSIGIILIALEAFITSFIVAWFGVGLLLIGLLSYFFEFNDGLWQLALASILSLVLLFTLRTKAMKIFLESKDKKPEENFLNEKGTGVIKNGKVYYKSIFWNIDSPEEFEEGEKVTVLEALKGFAKIEKIKD